MEHGAVMVDGRQTVSTLQCVHCSAHAPAMKMPGMCYRCMGPICTKTSCRKCTPWEKKMEAMERRAVIKSQYDQFTAH